MEKIEFHYTPKHASWLNAAEIEINVMDIECTNRRIGDIGTLTSASIPNYVKNKFFKLDQRKINADRSI